MGAQEWLAKAQEELGGLCPWHLPDVVLVLGVVVVALLVAFLAVLYVRESKKPRWGEERQKEEGVKAAELKRRGKTEQVCPQLESDDVSRRKTVVGKGVRVADMPDLELIWRFDDGDEVGCTVSAADVVEMPGGVVTIGRAEAQHIRFEDESVSRMHLELGVDRRGYWIEDVGSSAGTLVNRRHCAVRERVWLNNGDVILLGDVELEVVLRDSSAIA